MGGCTMRGMQPLVQMRREGVKPEWVFVDTDAGPQALPAWAQWQNVDEGLCDIDITPTESLLRIDWRPLVGLGVFVSGTNWERVRLVAQAIKEAGAKRVISSGRKRIGTEEWPAFLTEWVRDTAGLMGEKPGELHGASAV